MSSNLKVFITGSNGALGRTMVKKFVDKGHKVVSYLNKPLK
jgi:nucleoside-diphosphate-sugar epimerase